MKIFIGLLLKSLLLFAAIFILYKIRVESRLPDEVKDIYKDFIQIDQSNIEHVKLYISTGFNEKEEIVISKEMEEELHNILLESYRFAPAGRYNATKQYIIQVQTVDDSKFSFSILLQNFDDIRVILNHRTYYSSLLIEWFNENDIYIRSNINNE